MFTNHKWQSYTAWFLSWGLSTSTVAPLLAMAPALAQSNLSDVQGHWAQACIESLAQRNIIRGYPDGSFRPEASVTRAEFAAMVNKAFPSAPRDRSARSFIDVDSGYWAYDAIQTASQTGFLSGYPDGRFQPSQNIPRAQVLVALGNGLNYTPTGSVNQILETNYADSAAIPNYARTTIAAATENQLVVNYPNVNVLNPNQIASRSAVAAFLCQALKGPQQASLIPSAYIAGYRGSQFLALPVGTAIPVTYGAAERIIVSPNETVPLTLTVATDVFDNQGSVVIPAGSEVIGELQPHSEGSQFVAREVIIDGDRLPMLGTSAVVSRTKSARDPNLISLARNAALGSAAAAGLSAVLGDRSITPEKVLAGAAVGTAVETSQGRPLTSIARDTVIGAAAAAGISAVVGDRSITAEKVLSGAAAGATIGGVVDPATTQVVVIEPSTDLTLRLDQRLQLARR